MIPIDSLPINIAIYRYENGNFIFVDFNLQAQQTDNVLREEIIGKKVQEVFPSVNEFGLLEVLERVYKTGESEHFEAGYYRDEKREGWRVNDVSRLDNGQIMAVYKDVTQEIQYANSLEALGNLVDKSLNEIYIFNPETLLFCYANGSALHNIGYTMDELSTMTPLDIKPGYSSKKFHKLIQPLLDGTIPLLALETKHRRKDGTEYDVEARIQKMLYIGKEHLVVNIIDITDRIKNQLEMLKLYRMIEESELLFKTLTESALAGIFLYRETFLYVNSTFTKMSGYTFDELKIMTPIDLIEPKEREFIEGRVQARLKGELQDQIIYQDLKIVTKSGEVRWFYIAISTVKFQGEWTGLGTAIDMTERKMMEKKLEYVAQTDPLTGLYNRLRFDDIIQREIAFGKRQNTLISLIYMDIDFFKKINDTCGHDTGDIILKEITLIIREVLRASDYPFRWGGEEFIIICPNTTISEVKTLAERLRKKI
ncbi:MAG TPA: diguanylate cyclase, partial [Sulfuricurvum sp.]|nr:diguanylate cyclase [Sulfuricurvum sp.]